MTSRTLVAGAALAALAAVAGALAVGSDDSTSLATSESGTPTTASLLRVRSLKELPPLTCGASQGSHGDFLVEQAFEPETTPRSPVEAAVEYLEEDLPGLAVPAITDRLKLVSHFDPAESDWSGVSVVEHHVAGEPVLRFKIIGRRNSNGDLRYIVEDFVGCSDIADLGARED